MRWPRPRTIRARFLAINIPLVLITLLALFGAFEFTAYTRAMEDLERKLERLAESQAALVARSLWNLDHERVELILNATAHDPDLLGVVVYDERNTMVARFGTVGSDRNAELVHVEPITYPSRAGPQRIGQLVVALTDSRVQAATHERLAFAGGLALLILLLVVISAVIANRWTIGIPLARLTQSIDRASADHVREPVVWDTDDEMGAVVRAFNRMQARQAEYEAELHRARDEMERRIAERTAELARARDAAEAANKAKSGFLANMSHELRTPLNAIIGFAEILENQSLAGLGVEKYAEYAQDIRRSGEHLLGLINDLLDLSKAEAGKLTLEESEFDLRRAIDRCIAMVQPRADGSNVGLDVALPPALPPVYADERKIRQILINLLSNAVKFTPPGGHVRVEVAWSDSALEIAVADTGIGIDSNDIQRILQPFTQVDSDLNRKYEGTGLGLPLVKALAELHGGELVVQSELHKGSRMTIRLTPDRVVQPPAPGQAPVDLAVS